MNGEKEGKLAYMNTVKQTASGIPQDQELKGVSRQNLEGGTGQEVEGGSRGRGHAYHDL